jgi:outer membrane protein OmpA-like peptidoglycan-associated protein
LNEIGAIMKKHADWALRIAGHTDNVGGNGEYNLQLSRVRR